MAIQSKQQKKKKTTKKNTTKKKVTISVSQKAKIVKKDSIRNDTLPKAPAKTLLPTNGITFKVKMRKK